MFSSRTKLEEKLHEIHTHTEFLIVYILVPEEKSLQAAG